MNIPSFHRIQMGSITFVWFPFDSLDFPIKCKSLDINLSKCNCNCVCNHKPIRINGYNSNGNEITSLNPTTQSSLVICVLVFHLIFRTKTKLKIMQEDSRIL